MAAVLWHHKPCLKKFCGNTVIKKLFMTILTVKLHLEAINYQDCIVDQFQNG